MIKTILFIVIATAIILGTSIQFVEAISWPGLIREIGLPMGTEVYEVSDVSVIPSGGPSEKLGNEVQLRCLDGDWLYDAGLPFSMTSPQLPDFEGTGTQIGLGMSKDIHEIDPNEIESPYSKLIGYDVTPKRGGPIQLFDIEVIVTILCLNPSPLMQVGGEWQATDTTALLIGYSVLNAYWIAPITLGIGVGLYLARNKWNRN